MTSGVKISVDDLAIGLVASLSVRLSTRPEADSYQATFPNEDDRYTGLLKDTQGRTVRVAIEGDVKLSGICDSATFGYGPGVIEIAGRDWAGVLVDEVAPESLLGRLKGKRSHEGLRLIASEYGFGLAADTGSWTFPEEQGQQAGTRVWEIVRNYAEMEGFDVWVDPQRVIQFHARTVPGSASRVYRVGGAGPGIRPIAVSLAQDKTLSLALKVRVIGYDSDRGRRIVYTAESPLRNRPNYKLIEVPDYSLTTDAAVRRRAEVLLAAYSMGLVTGEVVVPWSDAPARREAIELVGCAWADRYYVVGLSYELSPGGRVARVSFANRALAYGRDMEIERAAVEKTPKEREQKMFPLP